MKFAGDSVEKKMLRYLFATMLICSVVVGSYTGCGPRVQVAGKQILDKIDSLLGEMNLQLQKVESKRSEIAEKTDSVKKKLYITEARIEQMNEAQKFRDTEAAKIKSQLAQLKGFLSDAKENGEVEIKGQTYTVERLIGKATDKTKALKSINTRTENNARLLAVHKKNLSLYETQIKVAKASLGKLDVQIEEIKTRKEALDNNRRATLLDGKSASITEDIETLQKDVDDLFVNVDANLRLENEKLEEQLAAAESGAGTSDDDLFETESDFEKTMSEIEAAIE